MPRPRQCFAAFARESEDIYRPAFTWPSVEFVVRRDRIIQLIVRRPETRLVAAAQHGHVMERSLQRTSRDGDPVTDFISTLKRGYLRLKRREEMAGTHGSVLQRVGDAEVWASWHIDGIRVTDFETSTRPQI
jgi:hypothetical protein